jgi:small subunit ribosomal protein S1
MSSPENNSPAQGATPERQPQPSDLESKGDVAASAPAETASSDPRPESVAAQSAGAKDADSGDGGEDADHEPHAAGDASTADPTGAPRKRRRRRRKKGGAAAVAGATGEVAAEGEAAPAVAATTGEGEQGEGTTAERPAGEKSARPKAKKHERKERSPDNRFVRERPAFGVGDVVFGKIIEITDDAVFIDLSGKARGIFDRAEMLLPDEPAEDPATAADDDDEDEAVDAGDADPTADVAEATQAADEQPDASGAEAPASEASVGESKPEEPASHGGERRVAGRRIIVAAAALAAEPPPAAATDAGSPAPDAATADGSTDASAAALDAGGEPEVAAPAEPVAPPRPAPYAPPIVLELGAHFVGLVHNDGSRGGLIVLTRHPRRIRASKLAASAAFREKTLISGLVTGVVRGGVEVDIDGLRAFAPGSHLDLRPGADLRPLVGRRLNFLVTQYGKRGRDVVLSRRPMLESEAKAQRALALERVQVGAVVPAVVKNVVSFGAFLDIGGVEGLVTLQEMSHNRGDAPHDVFRVGETIDVRIIRMDEKGKIWLSRKSAIPDPWDDAIKKYSVGTRHPGKVVRLQPFGAFVELEPGIDGLIHVGDLSVKPIVHPSEVVKVGDALDVVVVQTDPVSHKIALHPAPTGEAADEVPQHVAMHKTVKVQVTAIEPGGLMVRILGATGRHARGYITAMATGTPRGTELRKPFPVGTTLDAKVIEMDPRRGEIKLSIKALKEDSERSAYQQYRQQATREGKFGTFGDLLAKKDANK